MQSCLIVDHICWPHLLGHLIPPCHPGFLHQCTPLSCFSTAPNLSTGRHELLHGLAWQLSVLLVSPSCTVPSILGNDVGNKWTLSILHTPSICHYGGQCNLLQKGSPRLGALVGISGQNSDILVCSALILVVFDHNLIFCRTFCRQNPSVCPFKCSGKVLKLSVPEHQGSRQQAKKKT